MKSIKLVLRASLAPEDTWNFGYRHFDVVQADKYIHHISDIFQILGENSIGTPGPELDEYINALHSKRHIIYYLQTDTALLLSEY